MNEQILLPPESAPRRKFWKPWKWTGLIVYAVALLFGRFLPRPVVAAAYIYGIVVIAVLIFAGFRYLSNKLFWRVRNRLIGSFFFIGVIPLLTFVGIVLLSGYILFGQMAGQYLQNALKENNHLVSEINAEVAGQIASADPAGTFSSKAALVCSRYFAQFPRLASRLLRRNASGNLEEIAKYDPQIVLPELFPHPGDKWLNGASFFEGTLRHEGRIFLASLRQVTGSRDLYVETVAPLDISVEARMRRDKSVYVAFVVQLEDANITISRTGIFVITKSKSSPPQNKSGKSSVGQKLEDLNAYRRADSRKMISWFLTIGGKVYGSGKSDLEGIALFYVPWTVISKSYLGMGDEFGPAFLIVLCVLGGMFVLTELVSLVVGLTISRRVTRSVHDMYQGILALQKGDLQYRIPVRKSDQLGLLAHSFNQMSGSISRLLEEVVEKKKLEQELEIAREVQATLFPKQLPHPPGMAIFGGCKPARVVSGDYYDFVVEDETHLDIIVGDISGKGISAALLMANLQAAMRTQLLSSKQGSPESLGPRLADVMTQLNGQIYRNSPPEKYATLFLSRYDATARRLWYCNAGHLPPIVLSSHGPQALEATGTVVGLFPDVAYEAKSIELPPGTVLAIFTDGVTEAVNGADEEYGEKRLLEALQRSSGRTPEDIWEYVMSDVSAWQGELPQHDDITLIVAKTG
jgi:sigma-B regulation protein RsbU (phosphoserine phosphatase)